MNVLISGGAGGIGKAIAAKFISEGFTVYSIDLRTADLGERFVNLKGDVTSAASLYALKKKLKGVRFSHVVTLAGRALDEWKKISDIDVGVIRDSIDLNLVGHLNVIKVFYDRISEKDVNSIVLMSSINAFGGFGLPYYSAAKAGLIGYMKAVKDELSKERIRINVVAPGTVVTEATQKEPKNFTELLKLTRNGRFVTKEEVAELVFELCERSEDTGTVRIIDEGQSEAKNG